MTAPEAMTDAELAEEAGKLMGLDVEPAFSGVVLERMGKGFGRAWDPAKCLDDAARLGAAFLAAFHDHCYHIGIGNHWKDGVMYYRCVINSGMVAVGIDQSEARARTVAIVTAWRVMNGEQ